LFLEIPPLGRGGDPLGENIWVKKLGDSPLLNRTVADCRRDRTLAITSNAVSQI